MLHPEEQPRAFRLPVKRLVIGAVVCALCLAAACTQAVLFNDARWVKPMDLSTYTYQPGDLPMLAAGALLLVYIFYVIVTVVRAALAARRAPNDTPGYTRRLEWCAVFMLIACSLIYALVLFLSSYLLYRYERGEE